MRLQSFFAALGRAIDLVAECAGMSESDLLALGAAPADAAELLALHHSYFGPTHSTKKQRTAVAAARSRGHGLVTLRQIESFVAKVRDHNKAWDLRVELCQTSAELVEKVARKRLREWRKPREYAEREADPAWQRLGHVDCDGGFYAANRRIPGHRPAASRRELSGKPRRQRREN
ncbi:hypothetical protein [Corynebacterium striatum]|uniref:hypothetical protein n=1 Tax=Corynebacterium striatum TaxID=43770 RepID=UPI001F5F2093|nr:hypothetical protein [Corynebacterium striatum]